jgi:hypothetical protein
MKQINKVEKNIELNASVTSLWDVLTNPKFAKTLGNELDKNAFLQSDWTPGSAVYFKYEPDKIVAKGIITKYKLHSHIFVDYKEVNYMDSYTLTDNNGKTILTIRSGPYSNDYEDQLVVWDRWLLKVKELSEAQ